MRLLSVHCDQRKRIPLDESSDGDAWTREAVVLKIYRILLRGR